MAVLSLIHVLRLHSPELTKCREKRIQILLFFAPFTSPDVLGHCPSTRLLKRDHVSQHAASNKQCGSVPRTCMCFANDLRHCRCLKQHRERCNTRYTARGARENFFVLRGGGGGEDFHLRGGGKCHLRGGEIFPPPLKRKSRPRGGGGNSRTQICVRVETSVHVHADTGLYALHACRRTSVHAHPVCLCAR